MTNGVIDLGRLDPGAGVVIRAGDASDSIGGFIESLVVMTCLSGCCDITSVIFVVTLILSLSVEGLLVRKFDGEVASSCSRCCSCCWEHIKKILLRGPFAC